MDDDAQERRAVLGPHGYTQVKKMRRHGWTAKRRGIFLDHLAATANVRESARMAGIDVTNAYKLRRRDAQFAAEWDAALATSIARLEGKTIVWAETRGARCDADGTDADDLDGFDPKAAMATIALYRAQGKRRPRGRGGFRPHTATREELEAGALKALNAVRRRIERTGK